MRAPSAGDLDIGIPPKPHNTLRASHPVLSKPPALAAARTGRTWQGAGAPALVLAVLCRTGRLYDVETRIARGKPLQLDPAKRRSQLGR